MRAQKIGGFKFGDLVAHRQTAKLNVSPIFLRLRYIELLINAEKQQGKVDYQQCIKYYEELKKQAAQ